MIRLGLWDFLVSRLKCFFDFVCVGWKRVLFNDVVTDSYTNVLKRQLK